MGLCYGFYGVSTDLLTLCELLVCADLGMSLLYYAYYWYRSPLLSRCFVLVPILICYGQMMRGSDLL
jgi:hypothetical protein